MPVDGSASEQLSQQNSSSSGGLSVDAREFVPKKSESAGAKETTLNGHHRSEVNGNVSGSRKKHTGAVHKKPTSSSFYGDNRRGGPRNNPPAQRYFKQDGRNDDESKRYYYDQEPKVLTSSAADSKKFFKDNQNYSNGNSRNGANYYGSDGGSSSKKGKDYAFNSGYDGSARNNSSRYQQRGGFDYQRQYAPRNDRRDEYPAKKRNDPERRPQKQEDIKIATSKKPSTTNRFKKEKSIEPSKISQREQLIKDIESNAIECMICCEKIRDHQSTWNCSNCFHIQHLNCLKTWISNSKTECGEWRCVACQSVRKEVPKDYFCFCGKTKYPAVNRNDLAHSCGEMCGRTDSCQHPCTLRCHPGPHAICQSFIERSCGCGKSRKTYQCSMKETFECEETCGRILNCKVHKCSDNCHQGECKPCSEQIEMKCYCEKESKTVTCSAENVFVKEYSCDKTCNLPLSCGNHQCKLVCHPEKCGNCLLSPEFVKTCPCGRTGVDAGVRKVCTDLIPLCRAQCSKALKCGPLALPHTCTKSCHLNECPPCSRTSNVKCRCGRIEEKIACKDLLSSDVRCKKKCTKFKTCGKHRCNQSCCIEIEHECLQQCGRMLDSCKKHRCQLPCHIGNCLPCPRVSFDELRCECGAAVVYPPVPCGTRTPECINKCTRTHKCSHPVNHLCHRELECPPCVFLTAKFCYGKHEQRKTIPCNENSFSCGMPCGKGLKCGRHQCIKKCHLNECEKQSDVCKQLCIVKRVECEHNCNAPCHDGECPEKSCRMQVEVSCQCGNLKEMKSCEQVAYENKKIQRVKLAMQLQDGGNVDIRDVCGESVKRTLKVLECNDECKTLERNRRLDIAFKVENPNLISYPKFVPNYSEFIRSFYKKEPVFVNMVHDKLTELVKLSKESKQKSRSHSFPVMNRDKRHVIHDLAAMFGVETQAYDAEPNRNIVATASKESVSSTLFLPKRVRH